jgi:hypothetical protein
MGIAVRAFFLVLVLVLLPSGNGTLPTLLAQTPDEGARSLADGERTALRNWAQQRLLELDSEPPDASWKSPPGWATERLWALYFLSVEEKRWEGPAVALADSLAALQLPGDRQVRALGGALEVVRAKNSRWPPNKLEHLRRGLDILDGLAEDAPEDPAVRYLRLVSCYYLPFFLDRDESVRKDLGVLPTLLLEKGDAFSPPIRRVVVDFVLDKGEMTNPVRTRLEDMLGELSSAFGPAPESLDPARSTRTWPGAGTGLAVIHDGLNGEG